MQKVFANGIGFEFGVAQVYPGQVTDVCPEIDEGNVDLLNVQDLLLNLCRLQIHEWNFVKVDLKLKLVNDVLPEHSKEVLRIDVVLHEAILI